MYNTNQITYYQRCTRIFATWSKCKVIDQFCCIAKSRLSEYSLTLPHEFYFEECTEITDDNNLSLDRLLSYDFVCKYAISWSIFCRFFFIYTHQTYVCLMSFLKMATNWNYLKCAFQFECNHLSTKIFWRPIKIMTNLRW